LYFTTEARRKTVPKVGAEAEAIPARRKPEIIVGKVSARVAIHFPRAKIIGPM